MLDKHNIGTKYAEFHTRAGIEATKSGQYYRRISLEPPQPKTGNRKIARGRMYRRMQKCRLGKSRYEGNGKYHYGYTVEKHERLLLHRQHLGRDKTDEFRRNDWSYEIKALERRDNLCGEKPNTISLHIRRQREKNRGRFFRRRD